MPQLQEIKSRIRAIGSLRKVTAAMELVTQTRINRVRQAAASARDFEQQFRALYATVLGALDAEGRGAAGARPAARPASPGRRYVVGFLSQKGFCGDFNNKALAAIRNAFRTLEGSEGRRYLVGKPAGRWTQALGRDFVTLPCREKEHRAESAPLLAEIGKAILAGEDVEVYFVYNKLVSVLEQTPTTLRVYPAGEAAVQPAGGTLFEPDASSLSRAVVGGYLRACFERAYWESVAGENCARLLAMRNANDNASLILDDLRVLYNKTRQARITQELSEIVSAFDVLSVAQKRTREERV